MDMEDPESFELMRIAADTVDRAIDRAKRYRLLNDPQPAESICLDVLEVDPSNQLALVTLILSMTDQFCESGGASHLEARRLLARLDDEFERSYYAGIICEKRARAFMGRGMSSAFAYDGLRDAMDHYEKAEELRPEGNDDAKLRWNSCVRTIRRHHLRPPAPQGREYPLE
jgi:hypothetical protein